MNQSATLRSGAMDLSAIARFTAVSALPAVGYDTPLAADVSIELLRTISGVLDIRDVFRRVSQIANQVLSHDCLELFFLDAANHATIQARSTDAFPELRGLSVSDEAEFQIVSDLKTTRPRFGASDPPEFGERLVDLGYRALLLVRGVAMRQVFALGFFAKRPNAYTPNDVTIARQLVNYVALAVSHEQLAASERQTVEARLRAERADVRAQSVVTRGDGEAGRVVMIGQSAEWKEVVKKATQVAATETTVFLQGESGTGKEVLARFLHRASARRTGPFVAINCAALPEHLIESELFGYERGAFTGAQQAKAGQIELASGGVLFLDEVSEMPPLAQAKLLRFLQEREFIRLGGTTPRKASVRVVAATNRDLHEAVERGTFREDLFYRLQVFDIRIPPLRNRLADIPLFVEAFLHDISRSLGVPIGRVTPEASDRLMAHSWPGNVRELHNVIERALILCEGGLIGPEHLSLDARPITSSATTDLRAAERRTIEQVLRETDGNKAKAARRLGLTRTQLYVRLRKYDLE